MDYWIDRINEWVGKAVAWLFIPFTFLVVVDVFTRYVLRQPWFYIDVNIQLMGILALLGAGYLLLHEGHIGVDVLVIRLSPKHRAMLDLVLFPVFIGCIGVLLWRTGIAAWDSWMWLERSTSALEPPLYPFKTIMVIGIFLILLQGVAQFIRNIRILNEH